jgi:hypothetical protein
MAQNYVRVTELDFDQIKENLKTYLRGQSQFTDYDFEGSNLSVLIDLLAYNTHYNAILANMVTNEMFIDTALKRNNVASLAKHLSYTPRSRRGARSIVSISVQNVPGNPNYLTLPIFTPFTTTVDGTTLTFYTVNAYSATPVAGVYTFEDVELVQGRQLEFYWPVPNNPGPATKYVIPNLDVDTTTLQVAVQYGGTGSFSESFIPVTDITGISGTSLVYYLEQNPEGFYELYFGDGVLGTNLTAGDIVKARYLVTDGDDGNVSTNIELSWSTNTIAGETVNDRTITTLSKPSGGAAPETTDQIRFNAKNALVTQNRTVTKTDFASTIASALPGAQSVNCWGGETNVPPKFGTVFISIKPYIGYVLTDAEKNRLVEQVLRPRSVVTLQYEFVDPEFTYVGLDISVRYRTTATNRTSQQIAALAQSTAVAYFDNQLEQFNAGFYSSQLQEELQNMDDSVISNIVVLRQQKRIVPTINTIFDTTLNFPGKIHPAELRSTQFLYFDGTDYIAAYLADVPDTMPPEYEGTGTINLYASSNNLLLDTVGTVSYGTGRVEINNLLVGGYLTGEAVIHINTEMQESSRDLIPGYNEILVLDDSMANPETSAQNGITINIIPVNT